jgi:hypothetical protein
MFLMVRRRSFIKDNLRLRAKRAVEASSRRSYTYPLDSNEPITT